MLTDPRDAIALDGAAEGVDEVVVAEPFARRDDLAREQIDLAIRYGASNSRPGAER